MDRGKHPFPLSQEGKQKNGYKAAFVLSLEKETKSSTEEDRQGEEVAQGL